MKKTTFLLILGVVFLSSPVNATQPENKEYDFIVFGVPQYIITNGLRVDFDIHRKNTPNWLIISPYYYFDRLSVDLLNLSGSSAYYDPYNYKQMMGFGMGIARRTFLSKEPVSQGFYLHYGSTYKYFNIDGENFTWVEYTGHDGLPYQHMEDIDFTMHIHALNAYSCLGYQVQAVHRLYLDFFIGFSLKYAFHKSPDNVTLKYNRGVDDFGFIGTHMTGGIRIGFGAK